MITGSSRRKKKAGQEKTRIQKESKHLAVRVGWRVTERVRAWQVGGERKPRLECEGALAKIIRGSNGVQTMEDRKKLAGEKR